MKESAKRLKAGDDAEAAMAGGREALLRLSKTGSGAAKLLGQMK